MPTVVEHTGGWGCQCKAFRARVPHHYLVDTISRAALVQVERLRANNVTGSITWRAWTGEDIYLVVYDPRTSGGWCKHIAACVADLAGGQTSETYHAIKEMNEECHELRKENKKLERMLETAQRKAEQTKTSARPAAL